MSALRHGFAALLLLGGIALVGAAGPSPDAPTEPPALAGTAWHTVRIRGDALFFIIHEIGLRFDDATHFTVAVRFTDEQVKSAEGTYQVDDDVITLSLPGHGSPKRVDYRRDGADLVLTDHAFGVTCRFVPGKMKAHHWF